MELWLQIESHAHLALEGLTTPTTVTRLEAQRILTPEAARPSLVAEDEIKCMFDRVNQCVLIIFSLSSLSTCFFILYYVLKQRIPY